MQQQQPKYALDRVSNLLSEKLRALGEKHKITPQKLSSTERFELVRDRKVKLKNTVSSISTYCDVADVFDFSKYENTATHDPKYEPAADALKKTADTVRDKIMLGDATEALLLLEAFAAT